MVNQRRVTAKAAVSAFALFLSSSVANAARYESVELGETPVSYLEHRNSVNDAHDVAWTAIDDGIPVARLTRAAVTGNPNVELQSMLPAGATFVNDFVSRAEDINGAGDIVGYSTNTLLETRRHAVLWVRTGTADDALVAVDLHAPAQQLNTVYELTAAYGVSERRNNFVFVAGYKRTSVTNQANKGFSRPILWEVDVSTPAAPVVTRVVDLPGTAGGLNYGVAYDVAFGVSGDVVAVGALGGQSTQSGSPTSPAYQFAYRWTLGGGGATVTAIPATGVASYATSSATRIIEANGTLWTTGYGLTTQSRSDSFLNALDATSDITSTGGRLGGGQVSSGMGLAVQTGNVSLGAAPTVVGGAATVAGGVFGPLTETYIFHGMYSYDVSAAGQVCDVELDRPVNSDSTQVLYDISSDGTTIGTSGDTALLLVPIAHEASPITRFVRTPSNTATPDYWWLEAPRASTAAGQNGEFVFSSSLGCTPAAGCDSGTLEIDGSNASVIGVAGVRTVLGQASAYTSRQTGAFPSGRRYMQYSIENPAEIGDFACDISEVVETNTINEVVNACPSAWPEPSVTGFGGDWRDCIAGSGRNVGCETDVRTSLAHCGSCGVNVNDGLSCTTDRCIAGNVSNPVSAGSCLISGACYADEDFRPGPYGGRNPCQSCEVDLTQSAWSNDGTPGCCSNGVAILDTYDNAGGGTAPDKNRGDSINSVSALNGKSDDNAWSRGDRECTRTFLGVCTRWRDLPVTCEGAVSTGTARFNPDVDTRDWYRYYASDTIGSVFGIPADTNGNPEPRARVILQDPFTAQVCFYVDCAGADNNGGLIPRKTTGTAWTSVANGASGSPAANGRGQCTTISGVGAIADLEGQTEGCDGGGFLNNNNEGWLVVSVEAVGVSNLVCGATDYKIRWGNDKQVGHYDGDSGCLDCCN